MTFEQAFLTSTIQRFKSYQQMAESAMRQITTEQFFQLPANGSNSIAVIIKHMAGNMLSRWTDFLTSDGEKSWRDREGEFVMKENDQDELMAGWQAGWVCLLETLSSLKAEDLTKLIYIREEPLNVTDAIIRQVMHYSYHVGQIVLLAKWLAGPKWQPFHVGQENTKTSEAGQ